MDTISTCPLCGKPFKRKMCVNCRINLEDIDANGVVTILSEENLDRTKPYKVHGLVDGQKGRGATEYYPGELVEYEEPEQKYFVTDESRSMYVDGGRKYFPFVMPMRDIAITYSVTGMAMNSTRYTGPYGEALRSPEYSEDNILKPGEVVLARDMPKPMPFGMMGSMDGMAMLNGSPMLAAPVDESKEQKPAEEPWTCICGFRNERGRFCSNCGYPRK